MTPAEQAFFRWLNHAGDKSWDNRKLWIGAVKWTLGQVEKWYFLRPVIPGLSPGERWRAFKRELLGGKP